MEEQIRYLVQAECLPAPAGHAEAIVGELRRCFSVSDYKCDGSLLTLELRSGHQLADGAFKDLADLLIEALNRRQLRLRSGVINRVEKDPLGSRAGRLIKEIYGRALETGEGAFAFLTGGSVIKTAKEMIVGTRLVPVMYFHRDVILDLALAAKTRRMSMSPATKAN